MVIGVHALAKYATAVHSAHKNITVVLYYEKERKVEFEINEGHALVLQAKGINPEFKIFALNATWSGYVYFQLSSSYNVYWDREVLESKLNLPEMTISCTWKSETIRNDDHGSVLAQWLRTHDRETEALVKKVGNKVCSVETSHESTVIVFMSM